MNEQVFPKDIKGKLDTIRKKMGDLALSEDLSPLQYITAIEEELQLIMSCIDHRHTEIPLQEEFITLQQDLLQLKKRVLQIYNAAEAKADYLSKTHLQTLTKLKQFYSDDSYQRIINPRQILFNRDNVSIFERPAPAQFRTWSLLRTKLPYYQELFSLDKTSHNTLSLLLQSDNADFLEAIDLGRLSLDGEIGYLALQRLKEIAFFDMTNLRRRANKLISMAYPAIGKEGIAHFNPASLHNEFLKLAVYALLNPNHKVALLGTGRAVEAVRDKWQGQAIYSNPSPDKYSWELNRAWLQAAVSMGYQFKLVEQHFPNVEAAILSGDPSRLIDELANEMRSEENVSQYNGNFSPTATPQEILALMDMGCQAKKKKDGSLTIYPPSMQETPVPAKNKENLFRIKRSHSAPDLFKAAPPPPLAESRDHFVDPAKRSLSK